MKPIMIKVTDAKYVEDFILDITFNTGEEKRIDLRNHLWGEVFEKLNDPVLFSHFSINDFTIEWPNGADLAPEFLYSL